MILAAHQPDLLPWPGFWAKMAVADLFDLAIYDQFQKSGYQRRVKMREVWCSVVLAGGPHLVPIADVQIDLEATARRLEDTIIGRYRGARYWRQRGDDLIQLVRGARSSALWAFNTELILGVREMLGIKTPLAVAMPLKERGTAGIAELCSHYRATTYLAGQGAKAYQDDDELVEKYRYPKSVIYSQHVPSTSDSILTVLMDYEDPMDVVMRGVSW